MKRVVKISQSKLAEILMREAGGGFAGDPNFQGASYRTAEPNPTVQPVRKINVELTEEELTFIEDVLDGVHAENDTEKKLLFSITQNLRNSLIKK